MWVSILPDGRYAVLPGKQVSKWTHELWDLDRRNVVRPLELDDPERIWLSPSARWSVCATRYGFGKPTDLRPIEKLGLPIPLEGVLGALTGAAFSRDSERVIFCSNAVESTQVHETRTGRCLRKLVWRIPPPTERPGKDVSVAISPDGRRAVTGGEDGRVRLWEIETGTCVATIEAHSGPVNSVAFSPDGLRALSGEGAEAIVPREPFPFPRPWHRGNSNAKAWGGGDLLALYDGVGHPFLD
jgi:WD40 repeat protein